MGNLPTCEFEGKKLIWKIEKKITARTEEIAPLVDGIMHVVATMQCAKGKEAEVQMALTEALANAVIHGAQNDPRKEVECCVACDAERGMLIVIRDPGTGFDPAKVPNPVMGQNIFSTHGRGIYLINRLVDDVRYEKGGTEIHMRIK